ncbi:hypothetical protein BLS_005181 [Venturia inaequalis]|uniref:Serine hydrolase domain-containing protein n=1 Tax=Venturia inaequalis TaxID=5025 RepID=A0A8H3UHT7_VENIN|nr:hypothetical protein EG328_008825 [Venturia inaequalis]KAE9969915.1 hypothetical protein BLS_005181 [Venturia inaequalis]KAE9979911.1 hypothetical protein EG327_006857 [Venturia inaequalis]
MGTNSEIFAAQTAALRNAMGKPHENTFEFVEAGLSCAPSAGIAELAREDAEYFSWYAKDTAARPVTEAIDALSDYVASEGPFDGVMGFSQGCALASMLLLRRNFPAPFSFAIFICAVCPLAESSLDIGILRYCDAAVDGEALIQIPTAHIIGAKDDYLADSTSLVALCCPKLRMVFDHRGGHEVPSKPKEMVEGMARTIQKVIAKVASIS